MRRIKLCSEARFFNDPENLKTWGSQLKGLLLRTSHLENNHWFANFRFQSDHVILRTRRTAGHAHGLNCQTFRIQLCEISSLENSIPESHDTRNISRSWRRNVWPGRTFNIWSRSWKPTFHVLILLWPEKKTTVGRYEWLRKGIYNAFQFYNSYFNSEILYKSTTNRKIAGSIPSTSTIKWIELGTGSTQPREDTWVVTWLRSNESH